MYPGAYDPDRAAVVTADGRRTLTYGQLEADSLRLADHLRGAGLRTGDHLALLSGNDPRDPAQRVRSTGPPCAPGSISPPSTTT